MFVFPNSQLNAKPSRTGFEPPAHGLMVEHPGIEPGNTSVVHPYTCPKSAALPTELLAHTAAEGIEPSAHFCAVRFRGGCLTS